MNEPQWVPVETVIQMHELQLEIHGGLAGVRDAGLLASAVHRPLNLWSYSGKTADFASLAACYAVGVARNHPFFDGNKRTAMVLCETFLRLNGCLLQATDDECYEAMIGLAASEWTEEQLAEWVRLHLASP